MSIGLYDMDMTTYSLVPFNLELMKLSSYYKKRNQIVILTPKFTPERHQKFILRKDYNDGNYIKGLGDIPNLEYGGYAFTNNVYFPLPREIEVMQPDTSIYEKLAPTILSKQDFEKRKNIFKQMIEGEHCRISLDDKTIWDKYPKQFKSLSKAKLLMFHDFDLGKIEGSYEEILKILKRARNDGWATKIGMKFPITIDSGEELLKWINLPPSSVFYSIKYEGVIDNNSFDSFISLNKDKAVYKQLDYYVTAKSINEKDFIKNYIQQVYRQIVKARNFRVFYTIKYEENFFENKMWEKTLELFNFYHNSMRTLTQSIYYNEIVNDTMFDFAKASQRFINMPNYYDAHFMTKDEIREIFYFIKKEKPELFDDFYTYNIRRWEAEDV